VFSRRGAVLWLHFVIGYLSVQYYTNCALLKSICASLNVKLCEKGTGGEVGREGKRDRKRRGKEREGGKGTPCVSLNFP